MSICPIALSADLIRCPSVTPDEGGALRLLDTVLAQHGFTCTRVDRNGTANLYARKGPKGAARSFGFNGHTDVVPVGDADAWRYDPFGAHQQDGRLWGRGATDMKSGVAAFVSAACAVDLPVDGAICLAITGDEEGPATDGTRALLDWMAAEGEQMHHCLVGEPTCPHQMGEMMKIGRRGSLNATVTLRGKQGHVAYPHRALNPIPAMASLVDRLSKHVLDTGTDHFDPSNLEVVSIDTGNLATNVIPSQVQARLNIRFNDRHSGASLERWLAQVCGDAAEAAGLHLDLAVTISGESFLTPPGALSDLVARAVIAETGVTPVLSTSGGTSDARFMQAHCPVVEFGLVGETMHQVDENVPVAQISQLSAIYARILKDYFA